MISRAYITAWRQKVPWALDEQVEQDLVISRALVEIFSDPELASSLAFRGGTALHKLYFTPPERYSEDIDLVQVRPEQIGPTLDRLRACLDPWLGSPKRDRSDRMVKLRYAFQTETTPPTTRKLKVEINCREHLAFDGHQVCDFAVDSPWFSGAAPITTFTIEELLATKLRALLSRRKGRDAFDLDLALQLPVPPSAPRIVECFLKYMAHENRTMSRAEFDMSVDAKARDAEFLGDIGSLLATAAPRYDALAGLRRVEAVIASLLPGEPWVRVP